MTTPTFLAGTWSRGVVLAILLLVGLAARLHRINDPPLDFHPTRQYRSALIARGYYYQTRSAVGTDVALESRAQAAMRSKEQQGLLEPPFMEWLACFAYHIAGGERLWIPRVISVVFWLTGGVFLFLLAKRIASTDGALAAVAYFLLTPFGIEASRSFQPDSLMVMLEIIAIYCLYRYHERKESSTRLLVLATIVSALAILVKPFSGFFVLPAFAAISICKRGWRRGLLSREHMYFTLGAVLPFTVYFVCVNLISGTLSGQARGTFDPHHWFRSFFWDGWLHMIATTTGKTFVIAAIAGALLARRGLARALLGGTFAGYLVYSFFCSFHTPTHNYYQMPFMPIVALGLAVLFAEVMSRLRTVSPRWPQRAAVCSLMALALILNIHEAPWLQRNGSFSGYINVLEEIGEAVNHSSHTVWLADAYGKPLQYHGELAGSNWPSATDLRVARLKRKAIPSVQDRLKQLGGNELEYFIVLLRGDLNAQSDLKDYLTSTFPLVQRTKHYDIYDLRNDR